MKGQQYTTNLRELIEENGYTFKEVSEETGISLSALFLYARGERSIPHESRSRIAKVIGCSVTDILSRKRSLGVERQQMLTDDLFAAWKHDLAERWDLYYTVGSMYACSGLDLKLEELERSVRIAEGTHQSIQILTLLTMGHQLQSCVLRDRMDYKQAHLFYQKAFDLARTLEDQDLTVAALAREGVTLIQQEKPQEAILYLVSALNILDGADSSILRGYILQGLSEAYARAGQACESWRSIEEAEKYPTGQVQEWSFIRGVTLASLTAQKGVNAVLLGEYQQALTYIDEGLKIYDPALHRGYARLLMQKAEACFGLGMVDMCVHLAQEAFLLAKNTGSHRIRAKAQVLHKRLYQSSWGKDASVVQFGMTLRENV